MILRQLKDLRKKKGLTQEQLARKLGISKTSYCKRENGVIEFTLGEIKKMTEIMKISSSEVMEIFFN